MHGPIYIKLIKKVISTGFGCNALHMKYGDRICGQKLVILRRKLIRVFCTMATITNIKVFL